MEKRTEIKPFLYSTPGATDVNNSSEMQEWKWITYWDDSIWYGAKFRTGYIDTTLQRRGLCDWASAYSVESLHRVNPRHISGRKTPWEYLGYEWGDAQMRTLCNLQRNCQTLVASKGHPERTSLHGNWQHKELKKGFKKGNISKHWHDAA